MSQYGAGNSFIGNSKQWLIEMSVSARYRFSEKKNVDIVADVPL